MSVKNETKCILTLFEAEAVACMINYMASQHLKKTCYMCMSGLCSTTFAFVSIGGAPNQGCRCLSTVPDIGISEAFQQAIQPKKETAPKLSLFRTAESDPVRQINK
jgi:hypothetical protein